MKTILATALSLSMLSGTVVIAQPSPHLQISQNDNRDWQSNSRQDRRDRADRNNRRQIPNDTSNVRDRGHNRATRKGTPRWSRGDRLPDQYRQDRYYVNDWRQHGLNRPPRGYRWVRDDNNDFLLAAIATGIISTVIYRDDRDQSWNRRYHRTYSYNDDIYYRECRNAPDPAGVLVGALIGGLIGHTASHGRTGATVAGVVVGGAVGAALTSNLNCEDRSYAYKTYYTGFNAGRPNRNYHWRNPSNNHRGTFRVGRYYNDPDGFRCATYSQTAYVGRERHLANGRACRQPDGTWAIVN
ncbi:MAG: RcnB family protein [Rhizomicrobium sp.]